MIIHTERQRQAIKQVGYQTVRKDKWAHLTL